MNVSSQRPNALPGFVFPVLCFTKDGDIWGVADEFELTTCGPRTLARGVQEGMELVDAAGQCWQVKSIRQVGYAPFSWRSFWLFQPRLSIIEHEFEPMTALSLEETQVRICKALDSHYEYWCSEAERTTRLLEMISEVRGARSIAEIHDVLGLDYFGD